jgi:hypothetical protein
MSKSKHNHKLSDEEFLGILRENGGLYGATAKAIQKKHKIPYSRQAVRERALKHPESLKEMEEENMEMVHMTILELIKQKKDLNICFKAARFYALTKGKAEFNTMQEEAPQQEFKEQVIKIGKYECRFRVPWKQR